MSPWRSAAGLHPGAARIADHVRGAVAPSALALAGLVAVTATLGRVVFPQQAAVACSSAMPCTAVWSRTFGFVSLPFMAMTGFAVITTLLLACRRPEDPPAGSSAD